MKELLFYVIFTLAVAESDNCKSDFNNTSSDCTPSNGCVTTKPIDVKPKEDFKYEKRKKCCLERSFNGKGRLEDNPLPLKVEFFEKRSDTLGNLRFNVTVPSNSSLRIKNVDACRNKSRFKCQPVCVNTVGGNQYVSYFGEKTLYKLGK